MYSKRFRKLAQKLGSKYIPDWMVLACWLYTIRNYPNCLLAVEMKDYKHKFIGD